MVITNIIDEYKYQHEYINKLNVTKNESIKALIYGHLISLAIVIIPFIITACFLIYPNYYDLVLAILLLLGTLFLCLGEIFQHKFLKKYSKDKRNSSLKLKHFVDTVLYLLLFTCSYLFIILLYYN